MRPTDEEEIFKIINGMKPKKSAGHDGLSSIYLKLFIYEIVRPLTIIINKSLVTGIVPDLMKLAKVIPIYKSKNKKLFSNYRPISLLPVLSKVLEKVVHKRLYSFMSKKQIFFESQYGFRDKHSTTDAITELCSNILYGFDKKESTLAVFLDLSKAFDTIDHKILLNKLEYYGIHGTPLQWFKSYLSNRKQFVEYNKFNSKICTIDCGVPQGSVLGPLLFILYTNDLPKCINKSKSILFADDTTQRISQTTATR